MDGFKFDTCSHCRILYLRYPVLSHLIVTRCDCRILYVRYEQPCGTMNLSHPATKGCFPPDGSNFHICCVGIQLPEPGEEEEWDEGLAAKCVASTHV